MMFSENRYPLFGIMLLVRHEHGQHGVAEDVARGAAEDHLAQPALGIGALDEKIAAELPCARQDDLAGAAALRLEGDRLGGNAVELERPRHLRAARPGHRRTLDRENGDLLG